MNGQNEFEKICGSCDGFENIKKQIKTIESILKNMEKTKTDWSKFDDLKKISSDLGDIIEFIEVYK